MRWDREEATLDRNVAFRGRRSRGGPGAPIAGAKLVMMLRITPMTVAKKAWSPRRVRKETV